MHTCTHLLSHTLRQANVQLICCFVYFSPRFQVVGKSRLALGRSTTNRPPRTSTATNNNAFRKGIERRLVGSQIVWDTRMSDTRPWKKRSAPRFIGLPATLRSFQTTNGMPAVTRPNIGLPATSVSLRGFQNYSVLCAFRLSFHFVLSRPISIPFFLLLLFLSGGGVEDGNGENFRSSSLI